MRHRHTALTTGNRQPTTKEGDPHPAFGHLLPVTREKALELGVLRDPANRHAALTTGNRQPTTKEETLIRPSATFSRSTREKALEWESCEIRPTATRR
jgi:hypothetical protein